MYVLVNRTVKQLMSERNEHFWTDERVEFLREWRARGARVVDLANSLKTTKGAIAGKCKRLDIRSMRRNTGRPPVFVPTPTLSDVIALDVSDEETRAWIDELDDRPRRVPTPLLERKTDQCAAVLEKGPRGATMCGKPTIFGPWGRTSWCAEHHRLYHRKDDHGQAG